MIGSSCLRASEEVLAAPTNPTISPWCFSAGKRVFDVVLASLGLIVTLPAIAIVAAIMKLDSAEPILFRQARVGRRGAMFEVLKFRTMKNSSGTAVTRKGDSRITRVGRFLRRTKIDELPQLVNVLRGDMSLVGPRPDLPQFWRTLQPHQRGIMQLRPGITGRASLLYRDEESLLAAVPEPEVHDYYVSHVLPSKVQLDLEYAERANLLSDACLLIATLLRVSITLPQICSGQAPR